MFTFMNIFIILYEKPPKKTAKKFKRGGILVLLYNKSL